MDMTERLVGTVTILDLAGTITIDADAARLKDKINSLLLQERISVLLNLRDVSYIDSGGLGQLAASYSALLKAGGALKLVNVNKRNSHLLSITRLVTVFQTFDSEVDAVKSFSSVANV
jgi:anti-sigma B factor antagonist